MPVMLPPLRLDVLEKALRGVLLEGCAPAVVAWAKTEPSSESMTDNYITLDMISGPRNALRRHAHPRILQPPTSVELTVTAATAGTRSFTRINELDHFYDTVAGNSTTDVADGLVAAYGTDFSGMFTIANVGPVITYTPLTLGAIHSFSLNGEMSNTALVLSDDRVLMSKATSEMLINIKAFSKFRTPREGAWTLSARAQATLQTEWATQRFFQDDVGIRNVGVVSDLSAIAGGHWESRTSLDVTAAMDNVFVEPIDVIETINATLTIFEVGGTPSTSTFTVP